jgi:hypothetical protein
MQLPDVKNGDRIEVLITSTRDGDPSIEAYQQTVLATSDAYFYNRHVWSVNFDREGEEHVAEWDGEDQRWVECMP